MVFDLDHFDEFAVRARAGNRQAAVDEAVAVGVIELVTVIAALGNIEFAVSARGSRPGEKRRRVRALANRPAGFDVRNAAFVVAQEANDRVDRVFIELGRVGVFHSENVAGVLDDGALHSVANPEERNVVFASDANRFDLPFEVAFAGAAREQNAVDAFERRFRLFAPDGFARNPQNPDVRVVGDAGVNERFVNRFISVFKLGVFRDDGDGRLRFRAAERVQHFVPTVQFGGFRFREAETVDDHLVELGVGQGKRDFVNREIGVAFFDDALARNVAEERDFVAFLLRNRLFGAADDEVRLNPDLAQTFDGVLRRFRFKFARRFEIRDQRQVDVNAVFLPDFEPELANRFEERQPLDVADRPADLRNDDVDVVPGQARDAGFQLVRNVRDDLHRLAAVLAAFFLFANPLVNFAGRPAAVFGERAVREAFVVAEVEVGFASVVEDVSFAVFLRTQEPRKDVQIRVELLHPNRKTATFEEHPDRGARQAFSERANDAAGDENMLCHNVNPYFTSFNLTRPRRFKLRATKKKKRKRRQIPKRCFLIPRFWAGGRRSVSGRFFGSGQTFRRRRSFFFYRRTNAPLKTSGRSVKRSISRQSEKKKTSAI